MIESILFPNWKLYSTRQILISLCYFPCNYFLIVEILVLNTKLEKQKQKQKQFSLHRKNEYLKKKFHPKMLPKVYYWPWNDWLGLQGLTHKDSTNHFFPSLSNFGQHFEWILNFCICIFVLGVTYIYAYLYLKIGCLFCFVLFCLFDILRCNKPQGVEWYIWYCWKDLCKEGCTDFVLRH